MRGKMRDRPTLHAPPDLRERMEVAPPVELDLKKEKGGPPPLHVPQGRSQPMSH
jgi:hypothetical protein